MGVGSSAITSMATYELVNKDFPDVFYPQFEGARVMTTHVTAVCNLHTRDKMVKSLDDLEGMIIAGENAIQLAAIESWGATPEHVTMADGYLALERGVIDGGVWPWAPLRPFGLAEELNYHTTIDFNFSVDYPCMNEETWNSLPPDIQAIFDEVLGINWAALTGYTLDNGSAVDMAWMADKGDEFYTLPADEKAKWVELSSDIEGEWIADVAEMGVDAEPLLARMKELVAKYEAEPYPEQDWYGFAGRADSPRRPE
jgi:TRAP-type C4-dicarboxylate transport system substrate-binding protein